MEDIIHCNVKKLKEDLEGGIRWYESLSESQKEKINVGNIIGDVRSYIYGLEEFIKWQDHYIKRLKAYIEEREEYIFKLESFINKDDYFKLEAYDIIHENEFKDSIFK